ncbi:hypothetical protein [Streptomyces sp. S1]|uniref:hypothetical protein n=1 Tax=Streptomyces sp. S1 TaxID=718288 RepID=UPI003D761B68
MSMEHPTSPALIRIPVRIVVLVVVLPVRMVWDVLAATGRLLDRTLLRPTGRGLEWLYRKVLAPVGRGLEWLCREVLAPVGRGLVWLLRAVLVWPWVGLWRYVVVPVARYGVAVPAAWLYRALLRPAGRGLLRGLSAVGEGLGWFLPRLGRAVFVWPWVGLWRYVVVPVARYGIAVPAAWLYRRVLSPLGAGFLFLLEKLLLVPLAALFRYVLIPLLRYGVAVPAVWLWTRVLVPVGREVRDALALCWRVAGFVSRAVGWGLKWLAWNLLGRPLVRIWWGLRWCGRNLVARPLGQVWRGLRWCGRNLVARPVARVWASVVRPAGRWVRDGVWAPARRAAVESGRAAREALGSARAIVREARRDAWRVLVGSVRPVEPREPEAARARTLGSTTNVSGAVPAPEISLRKRG